MNNLCVPMTSGDTHVTEVSVGNVLHTYDMLTETSGVTTVTRIKHTCRDVIHLFTTHGWIPVPAKALVRVDRGWTNPVDLQIGQSVFFMRSGSIDIDRCHEMVVLRIERHVSEHDVPVFKCSPVSEYGHGTQRILVRPK